MNKETTKPEKLCIFLTKLMDKCEASPTKSPSQNAAQRMADALYYLSKMSDEEFDRIIQT